MEITWHGDSSIKIKGKSITVNVNPENPEDAEISIYSNEQKENQDHKQIFDWPGEYEVGGVPIINMKAFTKPRDDKDAEQTLISRFEVDDIKFCHLGDLGHEMTSEMSDKIGDIDVLIVPVEGNLNLKKLQGIIEEIEPRAVLPVQYDNLAAFLKEMGAQNVETTKEYKLKSRSQFDEDKREYIVLEEWSA